MSAGRFDVQATSASGVRVKVGGVPAGTTGVVVELPPSGSIEGVLRGFSTAPVVVATERGCEIARAGDCVGALAQVRGSEFKLVGLTPASYLVKANNGAEVAASIVEVSAARTARVDLQAQPAAVDPAQ